MGTIDLTRLAVFVAVADAASFSGAARRLGVPKSSVSRSIAALEDDLDVTLLHRTTRRVSLSTAGERLRERVAPLLGALQKAVGELPEREEEPSGELRITAPVDLGTAVLADLTARFAARTPGVQVHMHLTNRMVDLVAEGMDLAFRISGTALRDSSMIARRAGPVAMRLYAAPSYLARRGTPRTPRDLAEHDWVIFRSPTPVRLTGPGGTTRVQPRGRVTGDEMAFIRQAVQAGAGLGLLPTFLAGPDVAAGTLQPVLPRWDAPSGSLWIVAPGGRHTPRKAIAFREFALEALRASPLGA